MRMVKRGTHATPARPQTLEMPPATACLHTVTTRNATRTACIGEQRASAVQQRRQ